MKDQREVLEFLGRVDSYGTRAQGPVERTETHISFVFKVGCRVFKLKKAVDLGYLDFSTPEMRRAACEEEVRCNSRAAPQLYIGVLPVTRSSDGSLAVGGDGPPVDWLVEMVRFDDRHRFDRMADAGGLDRDGMEDLAQAIADFHTTAEPDPAHGGYAGISYVIDSNARCLAKDSDGIFDPDRVAGLTERARAKAAELRHLLDSRRAGGWVRHCHGDLHLGNICLMGDEGACGDTAAGEVRPTLFDGIEFNPRMSRIDVLYDLAFVLMDLEHKGHKRLAGILFNRYLDLTGDTGGLPALPLFLSVRAAVRAHVGGATVAAGTDPVVRQAVIADSEAYLRQAFDYFDPAVPRLVAVGGLSGSGKSRMAREAAPYLHTGPGALVLRTDVLRKRLWGIHMLDTLPREAYGPEMSRKTYDLLCAETENALRGGWTVVADGIFARPEERHRIEQVARSVGVPFNGLWLTVAPEVAMERIVSRRRNPSDATVAVYERQRGYDIGPMAWPVIDSGGPREETLAAGLSSLGVEQEVSG